MLTPNDRFLERIFSWQLYLLPEFLPEILWKEIAEEIFFFIFRLDAWSGIRTRTLRLISQHTTYYTSRIPVSPEYLPPTELVSKFKHFKQIPADKYVSERFQNEYDHRLECLASRGVWQHLNHHCDATVLRYPATLRATNETTQNANVNSWQFLQLSGVVATEMPFSPLS